MILICFTENVGLSASYPIEMIPQSDGSRKLGMKDGVVKYKVGSANFKFDNLFGDKAINDNLNKILNENWQVVANDVGEAIPVTMDRVFRSIALGVFDKIAV